MNDLSTTVAPDMLQRMAQITRQALQMQLSATESQIEHLTAQRRALYSQLAQIENVLGVERTKPARHR